MQYGQDTRGIRSHIRSLERSRASRTRPDRPREFTMLGREWELLDDVFAPPYSPSTGVAADFLGLGTPLPQRKASAGGSLLEIGCGSGVISVQAALGGHATVVAADINPLAVENARVNAARHGVEDRVTAVCSDLFSALGGRRFDRIFWSSNYVRAPEDYAYGSMHERAYVDPGYQAHRRYLSEVTDHLTEGGRALLHFCDRGEPDALRSIAAECGRELRTVRSRTVLEGTDPIRHVLLEIRPATTRPARGRNRRLVRV
ncbi:50S ribosomal protein L11 methyltransferase [Streptomyces sp. NPDC021225]|uniref:50S ribosomal protein L11 methyltransferase n=1 Tax=Streptomyces sp. NPDC021225 TaxID=3365121 RepID=UPI0037990510